MGKESENTPHIKGEDELSTGMLRHVRSAIAAAASEEAVDRLYVKDIILNRLSRLRIEPPVGALDALIDDVVHYLDKSLADFAEFIKEDKSLDSPDDPE